MSHHDAVLPSIEKIEAELSRGLGEEARPVNDYDELFQSVRETAQSLQSLNQLAVGQYTPVVEAIVRESCQDVRHIERTLDGLLDFAHHPEALLLYKKLCRHYYFIDPAATARYIDYYREMWDSEPEEQP